MVQSYCKCQKNKNSEVLHRFDVDCQFIIDLLNNSIFFYFSPVLDGSIDTPLESIPICEILRFESACIMFAELFVVVIIRCLFAVPFAILLLAVIVKSLLLCPVQLNSSSSVNRLTSKPPFNRKIATAKRLSNALLEKKSPLKSPFMRYKSHVEILNARYMLYLACGINTHVKMSYARYMLYLACGLNTHAKMSYARYICISHAV